MKKLIITFCVGLLITGFAAAQTRGSTMYAATKSVALKASTGFFARTNGTLNYGDRVTVLQVNGKWVEVRSATNSSLSGWTVAANMSARQIIAGSSTSASAQEVALAGKGFNREVEDVYKTQGNPNYEDVDKMEAITVNETELLSFLEEGHLAMGDQ